MWLLTHHLDGLSLQSPKDGGEDGPAKERSDEERVDNAPDARAIGPVARPHRANLLGLHLAEHVLTLRSVRLREAHSPKP